MNIQSDIMLIFLSTFMTFLISCVKSNELCEETPKCLTTFSKKIGLDLSVILDFVPIQNLSPSGLDDVCQHADTFNICVRDDLDSCSELYKAFIQGLQEGYDKMCGVYNSDVLNYSGCLENERLKKLTKRCTRTMKKSLIIEPQNQCSAINEWLQCVANEATNYCWKEAAEFLYNVQVAMVTPIMDKLTCTFDPVSYPQPGDPIPRGCSKELLDRYPGLPDQLDNQMKTMIKIDFEGAAATCQAHTCQSFATCTQTFRGPCDPVVRALYEGMSETYDYICKKGKDDYMQNILCLNSYEVAEGEESCLETMRETVSENSNNTCRSINVYLGCMEYGADKYCKEKAAAFQDRINHLSVEPLGRQLDCILETIPYALGVRIGHESFLLILLVIVSVNLSVFELW